MQEYATVAIFLCWGTVFRCRYGAACKLAALRFSDLRRQPWHVMCQIFYGIRKIQRRNVDEICRKLTKIKISENYGCGKAVPGRFREATYTSSSNSCTKSTHATAHLSNTTAARIRMADARFHRVECPAPSCHRGIRMSLLLATSTTGSSCGIPRIAAVAVSMTICLVVLEAVQCVNGSQ